MRTLRRNSWLLGAIHHPHYFYLSIVHILSHSPYHCLWWLLQLQPNVKQTLAAAAAAAIARLLDVHPAAHIITSQYQSTKANQQHPCGRQIEQRRQLQYLLTPRPLVVIDYEEGQDGRQGVVGDDHGTNDGTEDEDEDDDVLNCDVRQHDVSSRMEREDNEMVEMATTTFTDESNTTENRFQFTSKW